MTRHAWFWIALAGLLWPGCADESSSSLPELPPLPDCPSLQGSEPCGGSILGTWRLEGVCPKDAPFPMEASGYCPDRTGTITPIQTGVLSIDEQQLQFFPETLVEASAFSLPLTCLEEGASCGSLDVLDGWQVECRQHGSNCECEGRRSTSSRDLVTLSIHVDGQELVVLDNQQQERGRWPFCVQGTRAWIRASWSLSPDRPDAETLLVLGP